MLSISRPNIQEFYRVLQKAGLLKNPRTRAPGSVRFSADRDGLTLLSQDHRLTVSLRISHSCEPCILGIPVACLADCSQRSEGDVSIAPRDNGAIVSWTDRSVPVEREYDLIDSDHFVDVPTSPEVWSDNPASLLDALRDAMRITDPGSTRYALSCVQLDGKDGEIASTDSHQALVQKGFTFPWNEKLLISTSKIFEATVLPRDAAVRVGKTEKHVHFAVGPWRIAFDIQTEGRFPDVRRIIPDDAAVSSKLQLHTADAQFLAQRIDQLPMSDDPEQPVTVDLNGSVAIRSRRSKDAVATELVLGRSQRLGNEVRFATDRRYLKRAIDLGFSEVGVTSKDGPAICRDAHREFLWAILSSDATVPPSDQIIQINSIAEPAPQNQPDQPVILATSSENSDSSQRRSRSQSQPIRHLKTSKRTSSRKATMSKNPDSASTPTEAELITQLLELRTKLRTIESSIVTIARHLRSRRKQQQQMKATLASLKQLQTLDV